jgi:tetratricopeptide (TPR) repeat protein
MVNQVGLKQNTQSFYTFLAFVFGFIFVVVLLVFAVAIPEPSEFQLFVFRTVLALAAAGVAAVVPGMLNVNIGNWLKASGAIAVFIVVYYVNPPELFTKTKMSALQDRASLALLSGNYSLARTLLTQAIALSPNDSTPVFDLAIAEFKSGNYSTAKDLFTTAFLKSGNRDEERDKTLLYDVSLIDESDKKYDDAIKNFQSILQSLSSTSPMYLDVIFSEGQVYLEEQLSQPKTINEKPTDSLIGNAETKFKEFLEQGGKPEHWAYYHLACIDAVLAETPKQQSTQSETEESNAIAYVDKAIDGIKSFNGRTAETHYEMIKQLLSTGGFYKWPPGSPVECPPLKSLVLRLRPDLVHSL